MGYEIFPILAFSFLVSVMLSDIAINTFYKIVRGRGRPPRVQIFAAFVIAFFVNEFLEPLVKTNILGKLALTESNWILFTIIFFGIAYWYAKKRELIG